MIRTVKDPLERRADIVQSARSLFRAKKYDKTTMQDVMESLGIAKGTIYHYFESKAALLEAVIEDIVDENFKRMQTIADESHGTALEKIKMLMKVGNISSEHEGLFVILHIWAGLNLTDYKSILQHPFYQYLISRLFIAVTLEKADGFLQSYQQDALSCEKYKNWLEKFREEIYFPLISWCDQFVIGYSLGLSLGLSLKSSLAHTTNSSQ